jgi:hypothetical protein
MSRQNLIMPDSVPTTALLWQRLHCLHVYNLLTDVYTRETALSASEFFFLDAPSLPFIALL